MREISFESQSEMIKKNDYLGSELIREYFFSQKKSSVDEIKNKKENNLGTKSSITKTDDRVFFILFQKKL